MSGAGRVGTRIDRRLAKVNSSGAHAALLGAVLPSYKSTVCLLCLSIVLTFAQYARKSMKVAPHRTVTGRRQVSAGGSHSRPHR